ncbi:2,3-diaminopropionate biosynthesis protein SbnA [Ralstonia pseudosolanacearum]|uniref:2,3-diaminopropionate biosynthesis protein SbnA n=1 Tax=Ralstonia pseudosolanacearum TaxID=1310165 RepID=UPI002E240BBC
MIVNSPLELLVSSVFMRLSLADHFSVNLKLEGLSATGSIKVKSAIHMVRRMEEEGVLRRGMKVIESSSGNLGLALAMVCAAKGYSFTCISDPNISPQTARLIQAYGANLVIVKHRDENGGFLGSRIQLIQSMLANDRSLVWINQYENDENVQAHYHSTGPEILRQFPKPDFVFVGAGTTGTLGGVSNYVREHAPQARIIAVDSVGSVTFGGPSGKRLIPGLGTSTPPAIRRRSSYDALLMINETDTVKMCRTLARQGMLFGGSTGTVLCGVQQYAERIPPDACVVAISPDMGDRYVDTIFSDAWVAEHFPALQPHALDHMEETSIV